MQQNYFIDAYRPEDKYDAFIFDFVLIAGASIFIALFAQIAIRVPFSPVPITGQTFAVLLIALLFGKNRALLTVMTYLLEGACGLPVFANAGFGAGHLIGPTGGYLIGFLPAVYVTALIAEIKVKPRMIIFTIALTAGTAIIFISGLAWLKHYVGVSNVLQLGFYPFIPGAIIKIALTLILLPVMEKLNRRL